MVATPGPWAPTSGGNAPANAWITPGGNTYIVPPGVYAVRFDAWGAIGAPGAPSALGVLGGPGGYGGYCSGIAPVSPGEVLLVALFGPGLGGYNQTTGDGSTSSGAGGPGGFGIGLFRGTIDPATRVAVAGGGGGGGGAGGTPPQSTFARGGAGGSGGGTFPPYNTGQDGGFTPDNVAGPGLGAVGSAVGAAGTCGGTTNFPPFAGHPPEDGHGGAGGGGGWASGSVGAPPQGVNANGGGGGGGGGGDPQGAGGGGGGAGLSGSATAEGAGGGGGAPGGSSVSPDVFSARLVGGCMTAGPALMLTAAPPDRPEIVTPEPGSVLDMAGGFTFQWTYAGHVGSLARFALRRRRLGTTAWEWFDPSGTGVGTWQTLEGWFAGGPIGPFQINFVAGMFTTAITWEIQVANMDTNLGAGPYSPSLIVQAQSPPAVTMTSPANGTAVATQRPTLTWTTTCPPGAVQNSWQVQIGFGGPPFYDSGPQVGPAQSVELPWLPSGYLVATVIVTQSGGQSATNNPYAFVVAPAVTPVAPTLVPYPSPPDQLPQVELLVSAPGAVKVGSIERSYDNGVTWSAVRGAQGSPLGVVSDWEVCPGVDVIYRCCTQTTDDTARSVWTVTQPVQVNPHRWYVSDPTLPGSAIPVSLQHGTLPTVSPDRQSVFAQMETTPPTVQSDAIGATTLTFAATFFDADGWDGYSDWDAFAALRATQRVLLVASPTLKRQWYVRFADLAPAFDLAAARAGNIVQQVSMPAVEVAAPVVVADPHL